MGSIPNITFGSAGNHRGGPPGLGYRNMCGNAEGQGRVPVPTTARGPNPPDPPDDDDDDDDDEDESYEEDDERCRSRRSPRRKRSRDRQGHNNDRPGISRKEAEKANVPPWPKITKLDSWKMALTMNVTSADPDTEAWMSWLSCAFVVNPDLAYWQIREANELQ